MSVLAKLRALQLRRRIGELADFYGSARSPDEISQWQLQQFNASWRDLRERVPYINHLVQEHALPRQFSGWREFAGLVPVAERRTLQDHGATLVDPARPPDYWRTTGGSTAEPIQIPAWSSENRYAAQDIWYARSWFGVTPADKLFMLWGHSHLLGSGVKGRINAATRRIKDALLGYRRHSAYDLSVTSLRTAADHMLVHRPAYLLGYAAALDRFARVNYDRRTAFRRLGLKVTIATAESFPTPESRELIEDVLGCPVAMEYGSVETGPIAHQHASGGYRVFWRDFYIESVASTEIAGGREVLVTSLYPRCVPLLRYKLGDLIALNVDAEDCAQEFASVIGRCNDCLVLPNGATVHSEAFAHAVKDLAGVLAYQAVQLGDGKITLRCVASSKANAGDNAEIKRKLARMLPELQSVELEWVERLDQTIAGKTRRIVRAA